MDCDCIGPRNLSITSRVLCHSCSSDTACLISVYLQANEMPCRTEHDDGVSKFVHPVYSRCFDMWPGGHARMGQLTQHMTGNHKIIIKVSCPLLTSIFNHCYPSNDYYASMKEAHKYSVLSALLIYSSFMAPVTHKIAVVVQ